MRSGNDFSKHTPAELSQMLSELNRFHDSTVGHALSEYYRKEHERLEDEMRCAIRARDYTRAHEIEGALGMLMQVYGGSQLFPGVGAYIQNQIDAKLKRDKRVDAHIKTL
jgi:hypothetical protein